PIQRRDGYKHPCRISSSQRQEGNPLWGRNSTPPARTPDRRSSPTSSDCRSIRSNGNYRGRDRNNKPMKRSPVFRWRRKTSGERRGHARYEPAFADPVGRPAFPRCRRLQFPVVFPSKLRIASLWGPRGPRGGCTPQSETEPQRRTLQNIASYNLTPLFGRLRKLRHFGWIFLDFRFSDGMDVLNQCPTIHGLKMSVGSHRSSRQSLGHHHEPTDRTATLGPRSGNQVSRLRIQARAGGAVAF